MPIRARLMYSNRLLLLLLTCTVQVEFSLIIIPDNLGWFQAFCYPHDNWLKAFYMCRETGVRDTQRQTGTRNILVIRSASQFFDVHCLFLQSEGGHSVHSVHRCSNLQFNLRCINSCRCRAVTVSASQVLKIHHQIFLCDICRDI